MTGLHPAAGSGGGDEQPTDSVKQSARLHARQTATRMACHITRGRRLYKRGQFR
jgi:hypothetical protein